MEKLTKAQVKSLIKSKHKSTDGEDSLEVLLCPSKAYPSIGYPFNVAIEVTFNVFDLVPVGTGGNGISRFDNVVNEFKYYNCNTELGKNVHYYIK